MRNFATDTDFLAAIGDGLNNQGLPAEIRDALTQGIGLGEAAARAETSPADGALNIRLKTWVLRDQDIPVAEAIGIAAAAATAALATGPALAAAAVTALASFAALCWKTWRQGAPLTKTEIGVLGFLELHGPLTQEALLKQASAALGISAADVAGALKTLRDVELRNGAVVELIRLDATKRWRARA